MKRARCCSSGSTSLPLDRRRLFYCILYFYDDYCRLNRVFLYIYIKIYITQRCSNVVCKQLYIHVGTALPARDGDFICTIYMYMLLCLIAIYAYTYILLHDLVNARTHHRCGQHEIRRVFVLLLRGKTPIDQKDYDKMSITSL